MLEIENFRDFGYVHMPGVFSASLLANIERELHITSLRADPTGHTVLQPKGRALLGLQELFADSQLVEFAQRALQAKIKLSLMEFVQTPSELNLSHCDDPSKLGWANATGIGVHRDGAWLEQDLSTSAPPMLTLKAAIWFSDVGLGDGNLRLWPSSHLLKGVNSGFFSPDKHAHLDVCANIGDLTWFDRRTFHSRTLNTGSRTRKVVFVEYSVTWLKRKQNFAIDDDTRAGLRGSASSLVLDPSDHWKLYWP